MPYSVTDPLHDSFSHLAEAFAIRNSNVSGIVSACIAASKQSGRFDSINNYTVLMSIESNPFPIILLHWASLSEQRSEVFGRML